MYNYLFIQSLKRICSKSAILLLTFLLTSGLNLKAQYENHIWFFGEGKAGLKFDKTTNKPSSFNLKYAPYGKEGSLVVTHPRTMELLFYSDGERVINKNHEVMENGDGLGGHPSSAQACLASPIPGQCNKYYIVSNTSGGDGITDLRYSIIDMSANNGLGKIEPNNKNILLRDDIAEGMQLIPKENSTEFWLVCKQVNTNAYFVYDVTGSGIKYKNTYSLGPALYTYNFKYNNIRKKISITSTGEGYVFTLDFNNATGELSNYKLIDKVGMSYDTEWSPDGTKLYYSSGASNYDLLILKQYDYKNGVITELYNSYQYRFGGGLKLGPDNKIYHISNFYKSFLSIIEYPDSAGTKCSYQYEALDLGEDISGLGLPIILSSPSVKASAGPDKKICQGTSTTLKSSGGVKYQWIPATGLSCNDCAEPMAYPLTTTKYKVVVTNSFGCKDSDEVVISVTPKPNADFLVSGADTANKTVYFTDKSFSNNGNIISWDWDFNNGSSSTLQHPTTIFKEAGEYEVTLIVKDKSGCVDTLKKYLKITVPSGAYFSYNNVCVGEKMVFKGSFISSDDTVKNISWDFGDNSTGTNSLITEHLYKTAGKYLVTLKITTVKNEILYYNDSVEVYPRPTPDFVLPKLCANATGEIVNTTHNIDEVIQWSWKYKGKTFSVEKNPAYKADAEKFQAITLIATSKNGCADSITKILGLETEPVANFQITDFEAQVFDSSKVTLANHSLHASTYYWEINNGWSSTLVNPLVHLPPGRHKILLTAINNTGCVDTTSKYINISSLYNIYIPNVFTPNADNTNDFFKISYYGITEFEIFIFNRWGEIIFRENKPDFAWDGKFKGKLVQDDIYIYYINLKDVNKKSHYYHGNITVIK